MKKLRRWLLLLTALLLVSLTGCGEEEDVIGGADGPTSVWVKETEESGEVSDTEEAEPESEEALTVEEGGSYTSKEEVALYIHEYGRLPDNFISKTKARKAGWDSSEGNLDEVLPGMSIGGSQYQNYDGQLPDQPGRTWTECDINYHGGYRGAERIIFSNDGLIYYTGNHYETFEQLY